MKLLFTVLIIAVSVALSTYRLKIANKSTSLSSVTDQSPNSPLIVTQSSSVVVIEYEAWFTSLHPLATIPHAYEPLLTSADRVALGEPGYTSENPSVISQHISWIEAMGANAIIAEQTNSGPCDMGYGSQLLCSTFLKRIGVGTETQSQYIAFTTSVDHSTLNLFPEFARNGTPLKIISLLDAQDPEMYIPFTQGGQTKSSTALGNQLQILKHYMSQYPQMNVIYQGKPLVLVYVGASQGPGNPDSIVTKAQAFAESVKDQFTIRIMASLVGSQPSLWVEPNSILGLREVNRQYQVWSWIDRLNTKAGILPSFTTTMNSRVEAFTVSSATQGTIVNANDGAWNSFDASLYENGATFQKFMTYANSLRPIFLIVNQFNEYAKPDQGNDIEHSNDLEPTKQWGFAKYNVAKEQLTKYVNQSRKSHSR